METDIEMLQNLENSRELNKSVNMSDSSNEESNDCDGVFLRSIRQEVTESYEEETNLSEIFYLQSDYTVEPKIIKTEINHNVQNTKPKVNVTKPEPTQADTNLKKFYEEFNENEFVEFYEQDQQMTEKVESSQDQELSVAESVAQSPQSHVSASLEPTTPVKKLANTSVTSIIEATKKDSATLAMENAMFTKTEDASGIMIYKCNLCAYFSTTEQYVKRHVARHVAVDPATNQKLLKCLKCIFKSDCQTTMFNHWSENHADNKDNFGFKLHKCQYCTYKTKSVENLKEHETSVHFPTKDIKDESSASNDGNSFNIDGSSFTTDGNSFNIDGNSFNTDGNSFNLDGNSFNADGNTFNIDENSLNTDGNIIIKDDMMIDDVLIKDEFMPNINIASVDSIDDNNSLSESFPNTVVSNDTTDSEVSTAVELVNEFGREEVIEEISPELVIKVEIVKDAAKDQEVLRYKCIDCSYQSINRANLERHCVKHKNPQDIVWHHCEKCQFKTPYSKNLKRHMESAHKEKTSPTEFKYPCDQCKKRFEFFYLLKKHKISHTKPTIYRCKTCLFETSDRAEYSSHNSTHRKENTKVENVINKIDTSQVENVVKLNLTVKNEVKTEDISEDNNVVEITVEDLANEEPKPTVIQKSYKCHLCSYETPLITDLTNHSLSHKTDYQQNRTQPNLIKCEHCAFKAKSRHIMLRHSIVHKTGDDVVWFYCDYCEFKTKHKNVRRTHMKRHSERGDRKKSDSEEQAMMVCENESSSDI